MILEILYSYATVKSAQVSKTLYPLRSQVIIMHRDQIIAKLRELKEYFDEFHIISISLFGSAARNETTQESDIDLLIDFSPESRIGLFGLARLQKTIQEVFNCKVDLVTRDALHPALRETILKEAIRVT